MRGAHGESNLHFWLCQANTGHSQVQGEARAANVSITMQSHACTAMCAYVRCQKVWKCICSGEHKTQSGWEAVTIKKRILPPGIFNWLPAEAAALQEEAALMAVREALQAIPEPHHITHYLESYRHTDVTDGMEYMYYITRQVWLPATALREG